MPGATAMPTSAVNTTSDITRGFISATKVLDAGRARFRMRQRRRARLGKVGAKSALWLISDMRLLTSPADHLIRGRTSN